MKNKDKHEQEVIKSGNGLSSDKAYKQAKANQERVIAFRTAITNSFVEMARLLVENRDMKYYKLLGCDSFEEWLGTPEISISRAYAYGLMKIHDIFITKHKMQPDQINIDISKLLMLNKLENKGLLEDKTQAESWVKKADSLSFSDLKTEVQEATGVSKDEIEAEHIKKTECEAAWHILKLRISGMDNPAWLYNTDREIKCINCDKVMTKENIKETLLTGDCYALQAIECDTCKHEFLILHVFE